MGQTPSLVDPPCWGSIQRLPADWSEARLKKEIQDEIVNSNPTTTRTLGATSSPHPLGVPHLPLWKAGGLVRPRCAYLQGQGGQRSESSSVTLSGLWTTPSHREAAGRPFPTPYVERVHFAFSRTQSREGSGAVLPPSYVTTDLPALPDRMPPPTGTTRPQHGQCQACTNLDVWIGTSIHISRFQGGWESR